MEERGYRIGNLDVTLILQSPKVKDIKPAMKTNLVNLLQTAENRVNIKARTHEKASFKIICVVYFIINDTGRFYRRK